MMSQTRKELDKGRDRAPESLKEFKIEDASIETKLIAQIQAFGYSEAKSKEITHMALVVQAEFMAKDFFRQLQDAICADDWVHASALAREVAWWCDEQQRRSES